MDGNICKFISTENKYDNINTINFVYETASPAENRFAVRTCYILHLVTEGSGSLRSTQKTHKLKKGDLFFTFPSSPFSIESEKGDLAYMYISFMGIRAGKILESLSIKSPCCIFPNYHKLIAFWKHALAVSNENNLAMLSESVLLYSLSLVSNNVEPQEKISSTSDTIVQIKRYIDSSYTNVDISLDSICSIYQYNKKYLSNALKKELHVGFSEYLRTLRIQHACMLMAEGLSNVKDVAYLSGYKDPLYFSKVFKATMGVSPKEHISSLKSKSV